MVATVMNFVVLDFDRSSDLSWIDLGFAQNKNMSWDVLEFSELYMEKYFLVILEILVGVILFNAVVLVSSVLIKLPFNFKDLSLFAS